MVVHQGVLILLKCTPEHGYGLSQHDNKSGAAHGIHDVKVIKETNDRT